MSLWTICFAIYQDFMKLWDPKMPDPTKPFDQKLAVANLLFRKSAGYTSYYPDILDPHRIISSFIGKLTQDQSTQIAGLFVTETVKQDVDLAVVLAGSYQESRWYPGCYNHNLHEYNGIVTFGGTDWGMCQNSGYQLPALPGMGNGMTQAQMSAKAMDPTWAVPQYVGTMKHLLKWATGLLSSEETGPALIKSMQLLPDWCIQRAILSDLSLTNVRDAASWLALSAYNAGQTGVLNYIAAGGSKGKSRAPNITLEDQFVHGYSCMQWYYEFLPIVTPPLAIS